MVYSPHTPYLALYSKVGLGEVFVSRDIFLLTSLMTGRHYGPSSQHPKLKKSALELWSSLAFVLNTGHPTSDPARDRVVAVTGYLDDEGIKSSVVTTNSPVCDRPPGSGKGDSEGLVREAISPSGNAEDLLKWKDDLEYVYADVLALSVCPS